MKISRYNIPPLIEWKIKFILIWSFQYAQNRHLTKFNLFHDKNSKQIKCRRNIPQHNKDHMWQAHWVKSFLYEIMNKTSVPILTTPVENNTGSSSQSKKRNKRHPDRKDVVKLYLFPYDMILYIENSKESIKNTVRIINKFSKVLGYKVNLQKSPIVNWQRNKIFPFQ